MLQKIVRSEMPYISSTHGSVTTRSEPRIQVIYVEFCIGKDQREEKRALSQNLNLFEGDVEGNGGLP